MATQPNLPNYQLSKAPEMILGVQAQMNQNLVAAMQNLAKVNKEKRAQKAAIDKEARTVQNAFLNKFNEIDGSLVGQLDKANRTWARQTATEMNRLYTIAYGSSGTQQDKDIYQEFHQQAMYNIKVIGANATYVANNQKAWSAQQSAIDAGSKGQDLFADGWQYTDAEPQYGEAAGFATGQYSNFLVQTNDKGHVVMTMQRRVPKKDQNGEIIPNEYVYEDVTPKNLNSSYESTSRGAENLTDYQITKEDILSDYSLKRYEEGKFNDVFKNDMKKINVSKYDPTTRKWMTKQSVQYESLQDIANNNPILHNKLLVDLDNPKMNKFWKQMQGKSVVEGGVEGQPGSELPWKVMYKLNDDKLKKLITGQEGYKEFDEDLDIDGTPGTDDQPREFAGIADPTPETDWTPEDLQAVRDGVNSAQREAATQAWLTEYQKYRPEGTYTVMEQAKDRVRAEGQNGKWSTAQKIKYNRERSKAFLGYDKDDGSGGTTHIQGDQEKIRQIVATQDLKKFTQALNDKNAQLRPEQGLIYKTGAEIKNDTKFSGGAYGDVSGFDDDTVYFYKQDRQNTPQDIPRSIGITSAEYNNQNEASNSISQLLYQAYGYDDADQLMLTKDMQNTIHSIE